MFFGIIYFNKFIFKDFIIYLFIHLREIVFLREWRDMEERAKEWKREGERIGSRLHTGQGHTANMEPDLMILSS